MNMSNSSSGWNGPHSPIPVEDVWREFVRLVGGQVVEDLVPEPRTFSNADFIFSDVEVVAELKEVETEFSNNKAFAVGFEAMMNRLILENPEWMPAEFSGNGQLPNWFGEEFVRLFRPPISRILKKANLQIRETKEHFGFRSPSGILIFVNDGFTALEPHFVHRLLCNLLANSYSSIDCFIYLTVNRYVESNANDLANLLWIATYSDRADERLVDFVDALGGKWLDFLEAKIGPFTERLIVPHSEAQDIRMRPIRLPSEPPLNSFAKRGV